MTACSTERGSGSTASNACCTRPRKWPRIHGTPTNWARCVTSWIAIHSRKSRGRNAKRFSKREDVRPDVVDRVAGGGVGDEQVVLAEHALRQVADQHAHLGRRDVPSDRCERTAGDARRRSAPSSGSSIRRIDTRLASTQPRRSRTPTATWPRGVQAGEVVHDQLRRRSVSVAEVVLERRTQVGVGEGVAPATNRATRRAVAQSTGSGTVGGGASGVVTGGSPGAGRPFTSSLPTLFQYCRSRLSIMSPKTKTRSGAAQKNHGSCASDRSSGRSR